MASYALKEARHKARLKRLEQLGKLGSGEARMHTNSAGHPFFGSKKKSKKQKKMRHGNAMGGIKASKEVSLGGGWPSILSKKCSPTLSNEPPGSLDSVFGSFSNLFFQLFTPITHFL